jgi:hypothetical protein
LAALRDRIEGPWQEWEMEQMLGEKGTQPYQDMSIQEMKEGLKER